MTAFSRQSSLYDWGTLTWEMRTVNHRYLDITIRLPDSLRALEPAVRECLGEKLHRGKVEAILRLTELSSTTQLNFNDKMAQQLAAATTSARQYFPEGTINLINVLTWPGLLEPTEALQPETLNASALELLRKTLNDLTHMRQREGARIKAFIQQRLNDISANISEVSQQTPLLIAAERERMNAKAAEFKIILDNQRLEQEMAVLIQKTDVAEEIQRLQSHCDAMAESLSASGPVGRRLDFLSQELNREANTLGSKALALSLTQASVNMKVLIEQIREQVQNIE